MEACISDEAEVYTFDDWGRMGFEHVFVWYAANGKKKEYSLARLLPAKQLSEIEAKHRSVPSIHGRDGKPYINAPHLIIPDSLGGYITITQGVAEYVAKEER